MKKCKNCLKILAKGKHYKIRKYCNVPCQQEYQYKFYISKWKQGNESGLKGLYQLSGYIRKYILVKYDFKCSICKWNKRNKHSKNIPLEINHKDGNFRNNVENNLELLCPNCHSLTKNYKGANKGNGRKTRSKYYLK